MKWHLNTVASVSVLLGMYGCSTGTPGPSKTQAVMGDNNLREETDPDLLRKIGVLSNGHVECTAFLSGTAEITTAAHCLESQNIGSFLFRPAREMHGFKVQIKNLRSEIDLAVLSVEGQTSSSLTVGEATPGRAQLVAYNAALQKVVTDDQCAVLRDGSRPGLLTHTCDSFEGMSGGILLQEGRVVGMHLGSLATKSINVALEMTFRGDRTLRLNRREISQEGLFGKRCVPWCPGDEGKVLEKIPPIKIPGLNPTWSGFIVGGPVGALLNDRLALQQKVREMRDAGAEREAHLLELKDQLYQSAQERDALKNQLGCESAKSAYLPALEALYNGFKFKIQNAASEEESNLSWEEFQKMTEMLHTTARNACK